MRLEAAHCHSDKIFPRKMQIFRLLLVAMAMSLERLPNECKIYQALTQLYQTLKSW